MTSRCFSLTKGIAKLRLARNVIPLFLLLTQGPTAQPGRAEELTSPKRYASSDSERSRGPQGHKALCRRDKQALSQPGNDLRLLQL